jgi:hypothetical protein
MALKRSTEIYKTLKIVLVMLVFAATQTTLHPLEQKQAGGQEVPMALRILQNGVAVDNLQRQDIKLLIDGAPQAISGWQSVKKMVGVPGAESRRLFVLIFHLNEYPANMSLALDKLFHDLMRDNDRLLVLTNQATLLIENLTDRGKSAAAVETFVKEQAGRFQQTLKNERENLLKLIARITDDYSRITANIHRHYHMKALKLSLDEYLSLVREYKQRYLLPDPGLFSGLCPQLAGIPGEKWIMVFWQLSDIPKLPAQSRKFISNLVNDYQGSALLDENKYSDLFRRWVGDFDDVFTGASAFPGPDIYNFFAGLETTLHAFYIPPLDPALDKDAHFRHVAEQGKEILTGLARNSGGLFQTLVEPENDMAAIAGKTDSYYILNFRPVSGTRKIKISLPDKKMSAWFDPLTVVGRIKECKAQNDLSEKQIEVQNLVLQNRKLAFTIVHFLQDAPKKEKKDRLFVRVYLKEGLGRRVFDQSRNVVPEQAEIAMSLDLKGVPPGGYEIVIETVDLLTGKTHIHVLNAQLE